MIKWSEIVMFHPWVGPRYEKGYMMGNNRIRLLILGESCYPDQSDGRSQGTSFTCDSINSYLHNKGTPGRRWSPAKYWTKAGKVVVGPESYDRSVFWESISFYNYIQSFQKIRVCPPEEAFIASHNAFKEVFQILEPEIVVVLSLRLWGHIEDKVGCNGIGVAHPASRGFSYSRWHPIIEKKINEFKL